jgi:hypothetical protein
MMIHSFYDDDDDDDKGDFDAMPACHAVSRLYGLRQGHRPNWRQLQTNQIKRRNWKRLKLK